MINKITQQSDIKIGMWATQCCHYDLYEIKSDEQINQIVEDWDEGLSHDVYKTKKDALLDIRRGWNDQCEIAKIDKMLKNL